MKPSPAPRRLFPGLSPAILIFFLLAGLLEGLAHTPWAERTLPYRSHGIAYPQFDIKWFRLEEYVAQEGELDVVVLGNSVVVTGVDPTVLSETYAAQTGSPLQVFNFGLNAINVQGSFEVAKTIFWNQRPEVLVYVVDVRLFDSNIENYDRYLVNTPWFRYRAGDWNLSGWGIEHSLALQRYLPYRNWMSANFLENFSEYQRWLDVMEFNGLEVEVFSGGLDRTLDPGDEFYARCMDYYPNRYLDPTRLEAMQDLIALGLEHEAQVLVAEFPVHPFVYECMGGAQAHREFQEIVRQAVEQAGGIFLPALPAGSIPVADYVDLTHLNIRGARYFSRALGEEISRLLPDPGR